MISISIDSHKDFMGKLLTTEAFDSFLLQEATVTTAVSYSISGRIHEGFYSDGDEIPKEEFIPWSLMRSRIYEIIKGKNPPVLLRITLSLNKDGTDALLEKESPEGHISAFRAFVINIRFENGVLSVITGTSYDAFVPDKSLDTLWDDTMKKFLSSKNIEFEVL